jgi:hypothetical protein
LQALEDVIAAGDQLIHWLPETQEKREFALGKLLKAVDSLDAELATQHETSDPERPFLAAAAEMRTGQLLVEAGRAVETGEGQGVRESLTELKTEREELKAGRVVAFFFDSDLLQPPETASDNSQALEAFKTRATRTLDNMVTEARDVITGAVDKFKDRFDSFESELGELAKSFSSAGARGTIQKGVEKIVSGLKALAEFLKNDRLRDAIKYLRDMLGGVKLENILALAFGCADTKKAITGLTLTAARNRQTMREAGARMADLASRYVLLVKRARWVMAAIGVAGGFLALTGVASHYAALGVPIAYAVVALATVLIGIVFARSLLPDLIASV